MMGVSMGLTASRKTAKKKNWSSDVKLDKFQPLVGWEKKKSTVCREVAKIFAVNSNSHHPILETLCEIRLY